MRGLLLAASLLLASGTGTATQNPDNYLGETLDGATVWLDDFAGRPAVVAFWASWCAPCLDEIPQLQSLQRRLGTDRVGLVFVSYNDSPDKADALTRRFAPGGGHFVRARTRTPPYLHAVESLPATWLFSADGAVSGIYHGAGGEVMDKLTARLNALIDAR